MLEQTRFPPERLQFEITEGYLLANPERVVRAVETFKERGMSIALDDFGTGYASLSHIKAYPIGRLKIDRSFVTDMEDNTDNLSIVQAIVQLGRGLGLNTTAEGVENEAQLALLRSMGCGSLQGYYFSRPLPADALRPFLKEIRRRGARVA